MAAIMEATTAVMELLKASQYKCGIHRVRVASDVQDTPGGYSSEIRWSEVGDRWWTRQRRLVIGVDHYLNDGTRPGVVHVKEGGAIFIYTTTSTVSSLVANLATGLANKYIK